MCARDGKVLCIGHPLLEEYEAHGLVTSLGDYIREGALSTMHANAGRTPVLLLVTESHRGSASTLSMQDIYRSGSRCDAVTGQYPVEIHSGWINLPTDSALYWRGTEKNNKKACRGEHT